MTEREQWDWEREHNVNTPEGQIEAARPVGRALADHRDDVGRVLLFGAIGCGVLALIGIIMSL